MSITSTVANFALSLATETGTDYLDNTVGEAASNLMTSGHELVSGGHGARHLPRTLPHAPKRVQDPSTSSGLSRDLRFTARMPSIVPTRQDLSLTSSLPSWDLQAGLGDDLALAVTRHVLEWAGTESNLRFYGEPLALLALAAGGTGAGVATLAATFWAVSTLHHSSQAPKNNPGYSYYSLMPDEAYRGTPESDPIENQVFQIANATAEAQGRMTYGGTGSKYNVISEDMAGGGVRANGSMVAYIYDGAGGAEDAHHNLIGGFPAMQEAGAVIPDRVFVKNLSLIQAVHDAHEEIYAKYNDATYGTFAGVDISTSNWVTAVGVGDARVVTLRGGDVFADGCTKMHNMAQKLVDSGRIRPEEYYTHHMNNMILRTVGSADCLDPITPTSDPAEMSRSFQGKVGDLYVIASDGVFDIVTPYEIAELSKIHMTAEALQKAIFDLAYERNQTIREYTIQFSATIFITMPPRGYVRFPNEIAKLVSQAEIDQIIAASQIAEEVRSKVVALADSRRDRAATPDDKWEEIVRKIKGDGDNISVVVVAITAEPASP